jgi:hypothetical protein
VRGVQLGCLVAHAAGGQQASKRQRGNITKIAHGGFPDLVESAS